MFTHMGNRTTATVIPCGAAKVNETTTARELYIGSMFKDGIRTADKLGNETFILSAKYGIIHETTLVQPYNVKMGDAGTISTHELRCQVEQMVNHGIEELDCFLPKQYFKALSTSAEGLNLKLNNHFAGTKGIGFQKAVLKSFRSDTVAA